MRQIKGLDTLRAFAVAFVILEHWDLPFKQGPMAARLIKGLIPSSKFGVDLFFVLSGFLITAILLKAVRSGQNAKLAVIRNFIIRRMLRIFPIYYLTILILVQIKYPFVGDHVWWFVTYTSNILCFRAQSWNPLSHTWSLSVEEQFYLLWPWLIVYIKERWLKYVFYISILAGVIVTALTVKVMNNPFGYLLMPSCMQAFGIGGAYAYFTKSETSGAAFIRVMNLLVPVALIMHFYWSFSSDGGHLHYWYRTGDSIISIWLIHLTITAKPGRVKQYILENPVLVKIGQISYGIYLYHYALPYIDGMVIRNIFAGHPSTESMLLAPAPFYLINLIVLFVVALVSYQYFEKPILSLKRFFEYTEAPQQAVKANEIYPIAD
jgi:peptidoglycan/LPS O-acetylase OafA/YrhL